MASVEEEFIGALRFDVSHYTKTFWLDDNFYLIDMWDKKYRRELYVYYVHEDYTTYSLVIKVTADHARGKYIVGARYKWMGYPRFKDWYRELTKEQYERLLENILRLLRYSEKVVGSG